jgi:uncharacterized protein (TIRG00374 family)
MPEVESAVAPEPAVVKKRQGFVRRHAAKLIASALITFGIVFTVHKGGLKFVPEGGDFQHVKWWAVPAYVVTLIGYTWFRSVRWRFLLRGMADIPKRRLLSVSCIGFAAILLMPFRLGEFVRPLMIRDKGKISMTAATGSVLAERIIDGLYLSIVLALALVFVPTVHPLPDKIVGIDVSVAYVRMAGFAMLGLFAGLFAGIAVYYFARTWAHRTTIRIVGIVSRPLGEALARLFEKFADGLHVFGRGKDALGFFAETTGYWFFNALGMWLLARGCGVVHADGTPIAFGESCALMGMLGCAILIPGPPGMLGAFQAGIYAGMTMFFPTSIVTGPGAAYVFLLYAVQVVWTLGSGACFIVRDRPSIQLE